MCEQCIKDGKMTREEYEKEQKDGPEVVKQILSLLSGRSEEAAVNILLSAVINMSNEIGIEPVEIVTGLITGFALAQVHLKPKRDTQIPKERMN